MDARHADADRTGPFTPGPPSTDTTAHVVAAGEAPAAVGRFAVRAVLGAGSFGTVYRAWDPLLEREVALKVPHGAGADTLTEARSASRLKHPGVVTVFEAGRADGAAYIASEYVAGVTLAERLAGGGVPPREAARLVRDLAVAVDYAHSEGVVHRDLKPANVMLATDGRPQVMDFGLARLVGGPAEAGDDPTATASLAGGVVGTPAYMAPEQARGQSATAPADQYALGVVLYEMLAGRRPYKGTVAEVIQRVARGKSPKPPRAVRRGVPRDLDAVCRRAMSPRVSDRYASCADLAADLSRWLEGRPVKARPLGVTLRLARWARRQPGPAALALLLAAGAVAFLVYAFVTAERIRRAGDDLADERKKLDDERRAARLASADARRVRGLRRVEAGEVAAGLFDLQAAHREAAELNDPERRRQARADLAEAARRLIPLRATLAVPGVQGYGSDHLSPDGETAVSGLFFGHDKDLNEIRHARLSDTRTGAPRGAVMPAFGGAAFSRDGRSLMLTNERNGLDVTWLQPYDPTTGAAQGPGLRVPNGGVAWSPDCRQLLWEPHMNSLARLFDARTSAVVADLTCPGIVYGRAFSPDGRVIATTSARNLVPKPTFKDPAEITIHLWSAADGKPLRPPLAVANNPDFMTPVAFSADGTTLLAANSGKLHLWGTRDWKPLCEPTAANLPDSNATAVWGLCRGRAIGKAAFAPDGRTAYGIADSGVRSWNLLTGERRDWPARHHGFVKCFAVSPDGRVVITGSEDRTAVLWDAASGRPLGGALRHAAAVEAVGFLHDGRTAWTLAESNGGVRFWDVETNQPVGSPLPGYRFALSDGGGVALTDRHLVWDLGNVVPAARPPGEVRAVAPSPDGRAIVVASDGGRLQLYRPAGGAALGEPVTLAGGAAALAYRPDGKELVTGVGASLVRLDPDTLRPLGPPWRQPAPVRSLAFSPDGVTLAVGGEDACARLLDAATGKPRGLPLRHADRNDRGVVLAVGFTPDGRALRTFGLGTDTFSRSPRRAFEWPLADLAWTERVAEGRPAAGLPREDGRDAVITGGGKVAMRVGYTDVRLFDTATGKPIGDKVELGPKDQGHQIAAAAVSPDGRTLVVAGRDNLGRFFEAGTGKPVGEPFALSAEKRGHGEVGRVAEFRPDGKAVLLVGADYRARLWSVPDGKPLGPPLAHPDSERISPSPIALPCAAFTPDGTTVATGGRDGSVRLWNPLTGESAGPVLPHKNEDDYQVRDQEVTDAAFSPDGARLVTRGGGSRDPVIRLWDWKAGSVVGVPIASATPTLRFGPDGTLLVEGPAVAVPEPSTDPSRNGNRRGVGAGVGFGRPGDKPLCAALSPDARQLLLGYEDNTAWVCGVDGEAAAAPPVRHAGPVRAAAFDIGGGSVLTGGGDRAVTRTPIEELPDDPERLQLWLEVRTGFRLHREERPGQKGESESLRRLEAAEWTERRGRLGG